MCVCVCVCVERQGFQAFDLFSLLSPLPFFSLLWFYLTHQFLFCKYFFYFFLLFYFSFFLFLCIFIFESKKVNLLIKVLHLIFWLTSFWYFYFFLFKFLLSLLFLFLIPLRILQEYQLLSILNRMVLFLHYLLLELVYYFYLH